MKKYNSLLRRTSQVINIFALIFLVVSVFMIILQSGGTQKASQHTGAMIFVILTAFFCFFSALSGIAKSRRIKKASFNTFLGIFAAVVCLIFSGSIFIGKPLFSYLEEIWASEYFYCAFAILFIVYALAASLNNKKLGRDSGE